RAVVIDYQNWRFCRGNMRGQSVEMTAPVAATLFIFALLAGACGGQAFAPGDDPGDSSAGSATAGAPGSGGGSGAGGAGTGGSTTSDGGTAGSGMAGTGGQAGHG